MYACKCVCHPEEQTLGLDGIPVRQKSEKKMLN